MQGYSPFVKVLSFVALLFLMPLVTHADTVGTVSFLDGTDSRTFTDTTGRAAGSCQSYSCTVNIAAPQGFTWAGALLLDVWLNPGTTIVKDVLCGDIYGFFGHCTFSSKMVTLQFMAEGQAPLGRFSAGIQLENGILKEAGNIFWMNSDRVQITDSIKVQSDVGAVPEPSSLVILVGFLTLGLVIRRGRSTSAKLSANFAWQGNRVNYSSKRGTHA
jgi:hypothetical protein